MERKATFSVQKRQLADRNIAVVSVSGYVDSLEFLELQKIFENLLKEKQFSVVLDFHNLQYISSTGLGVIMSFWREVHGKGGDLKLARVPQNVQRICDILGFSSKIASFDSLELALSSFTTLD